MAEDAPKKTTKKKSTKPKSSPSVQKWTPPDDSNYDTSGWEEKGFSSEDAYLKFLKKGF